MGDIDHAIWANTPIRYEGDSACSDRVKQIQDVSNRILNSKIELMECQFRMEASKIEARDRAFQDDMRRG